ncbi:MAG: hypothetical protein AABY32_02585 [Nanoarchaeota archaeon]
MDKKYIDLCNGKIITTGKMVNRPYDGYAIWSILLFAFILFNLGVFIHPNILSLLAVFYSAMIATLGVICLKIHVSEKFQQQIKAVLDIKSLQGDELPKINIIDITFDKGEIK